MESSNFENIVGLICSMAESILVKKGHVLRITEENGKPFCSTCEWQPNRVNVAVENGVISKIFGCY